MEDHASNHEVPGSGGQRGQRVRLLAFGPVPENAEITYSGLAPGDEGTVLFTDSLKTVHVQWDGLGASYGLTPGSDTWELIAEPTLEFVAAEFPRWHPFEGVTGIKYARWVGSSPPVVVRGETWAEVREGIRAELDGSR